MFLTKVYGCTPTHIVLLCRALTLAYMISSSVYEGFYLTGSGRELCVNLKKGG